MKIKFPELNLSPRTVQRLVQDYKQQSASSEVEGVDLSRKRDQAGGQTMKLTVEVASKLIETNNKHWGQLSCKKLAGKLKEQGHDCSKDTVRRWCKLLGAVRRRRYIRPKLTLRHRYDRLTWVINEYNKKKKKFGDNNNTAHGDEKWFYLMRDGAVCRVFPSYRTNDDGEREHVITMPADAKLYHKSRVPKVMFLAVTAKPRPEYKFDGKVGIWPFTVVRKAQRSHKATGTVAGVTDIMESVTVTAEEYRKVMLRKDGVFDALRTKMWWFNRSSGKPEAGKILWYQHDGAKPHVAKANQRNWAKHGRMKGYDIRVVTQPAQSPDLNVNDLAFFASLQSDTELVAKENVKDLTESVVKCWHEYPEERMTSVWHCLYGSFKGILDTEGSNSYSHHTGSRKSHRESSRAGELHDRRYPLAKVQQAEAARDALEKVIEGVQSDVEKESSEESDGD